MRKAGVVRTVLLVMAFAIFLTTLYGCSTDDSDISIDAYTRAVNGGYSGTAEQFAAALVGECAVDAGASSYELAYEKGYSGSLEDWMELLTGVRSDVPNKAAYTVAVENGFSGTLVDWASSLVPDPQNMGLSQEGEAHTEYEIACVYGFEGTFIEWLVSLINTQ